MGNKGLATEYTSLGNRLTVRQKEDVKKFLIGLVIAGLFVLVAFGLVFGFVKLSKEINSGIHQEIERAKKEAENYVPEITIPSIDFTVLNVTETRVKWDLLIRLPSDLPGYFMCLKGDFQVFILYKGVTIANSTIESYNLIPRWAQQLTVSAVASEGDMDGLVVKDIMEDVKQSGEIRFGSRFVLPDCREESTKGKMNYACDEATLRFEPCSQMKATSFGKNPTCSYVR
ncbi:unnamed protein product [Microthlaspi erraticum]|uniref:Late embryogenesis abundant protein LEA-2 subgroup domain-containing protein n=1 Tax=Microthlaspi erraticum TaxID=1685480 RepID=A0A6D2J3D4_9BRAS|nr:unnamed protein product [Microthlaspi erraticum]